MFLTDSPLPIEHTATIKQILLQVDWWVALIVIAVVALIQWLFAIWISARLEKSIGHSYDKKLEDYRYEIEARRRAENVADYLSRLFADPNVKSHDLNAVAWQLSLWLPAAVYCKLAETVVQKRDLRSYKELLIQIRKVLLQDREDGLKWDNIIHHLEGGSP